MTVDQVVFGPEYWKQTEKRPATAVPPAPPGEAASPPPARSKRREPVAGTEGAREARVRRALAREGKVLHKDRARKWAGLDINHRGGYMIVTEDNWIVNGVNFELTLEQVEEHAGLLRSAD